MLIANPIYNVVFKNLMEDNKVAKLLIGAIIGQEIKRLEFRPFIYATEKDEQKGKGIRPVFTVYQLDFAARNKTEEGEKLTLIEIQKAKFPTDIMRFRRYLGQQYVQKDNFYWAKVAGKRIKKALPIISIYFLGHHLEHIKGVPIIKVNRRYLDLSTQTEIKVKEDFIESLSHDSYVISIPDLKKRRRTEQEMLLSVFDQDNRTDDIHILNVREEGFPGAYRPLVRRLQNAVLAKEIRDNMEIEDEILEGMEELERAALEKDHLLELERQKVKKQSDKVREEKKRVLEEKKKVELERLNVEQQKLRAEQERLNAEKEKQNAEKERTIASLQRKKTVQKFREMGMKDTEIAQFFGISANELD